MSLWAKQENSAAYWITLLLITPFTIDLIQNLGLTIMQAANKIAFRSLAFLGFAGANVLLAWFVVKQFGSAVGAAAVTGGCCLVANALVLNLYYAKALRLNIKHFWAEIGKMALVALGCMAAGWWLNYLPISANAWITLGLRIAIYLAVYAAAMWLLAMNEYEKKIFRKLMPFVNNP